MPTSADAEASAAGDERPSPASVAQRAQKVAQTETDRLLSIECNQCASRSASRVDIDCGDGAGDRSLRLVFFAPRRIKRGAGQYLEIGAPH